MTPPHLLSRTDESADLCCVDAALWRAHLHLSGHWLHSLRGSLNGISLSLVLLRGGSAGGDDRIGTSLRAQLRELTDGLTTVLDHFPAEDTMPAPTDVHLAVESVGRLVEPLAKRQRVAVEIRRDPHPAFSSIEGHVLRSALIPGLVELLLTLQPRAAVELAVSAADGTITLDVRTDAPVTPAGSTPGYRDALGRLLASRGAVLRSPPGPAGGFALLLPRSLSSASAPCPAH